MADEKPSDGRCADEDWQLAEIQAGIADLDAGHQVSHEEVAKWLKSWGAPNELQTKERVELLLRGSQDPRSSA
jgi:hypothetical protein